MTPVWKRRLLPKGRSRHPHLPWSLGVGASRAGRVASLCKAGRHVLRLTSKVVADCSRGGRWGDQPQDQLGPARTCARPGPLANCCTPGLPCGSYQQGGRQTMGQDVSLGRWGKGPSSVGRGPGACGSWGLSSLLLEASLAVAPSVAGAIEVHIQLIWAPARPHPRPHPQPLAPLLLRPSDRESRWEQQLGT